MKVNLTRKEIDLILLAVDDYSVEGHCESYKKITKGKCTTALSIVEKLDRLFPDLE